jgi:hypothetical protein
MGSGVFEVTILNWAKYQGEAKKWEHPSWFRIQNDLPEHVLWDLLSGDEFKAFYAIWAEISRRAHREGKRVIVAAQFARIRNLPARAVLSALHKLASPVLGVISLREIPAAEFGAIPYSESTPSEAGVNSERDSEATHGSVPTDVNDHVYSNKTNTRGGGGAYSRARARDQDQDEDLKDDTTTAAAAPTECLWEDAEIREMLVETPVRGQQAWKKLAKSRGAPPEFVHDELLAAISQWHDNEETRDRYDPERGGKGGFTRYFGRWLRTELKKLRGKAPPPATTPAPKKYQNTGKECVKARMPPELGGHVVCKVHASHQACKLEGRA